MWLEKDERYRQYCREQYAYLHKQFGDNDDWNEVFAHIRDLRDIVNNLRKDQRALQNELYQVKNELMMKLVNKGSVEHMYCFLHEEREKMNQVEWSFA